MIIFLKLTGILISIIVIIVIYLWSKYSPKNIATYISYDLKNGSVSLIKNGAVVIDKNSDNLMPLASTVKIIVAIEFAKQAAGNKIDPNEKILLSELEKFHIKKSDGGAHPAWLKSINNKGLIKGKGKGIILSEVARGMIEFSSNANTEFLMDKLGFDNVNRLIKTLGLKKHEPLYPFVSSLIALRDHSLQDLQNMEKVEYINLSYEVHDKLKNGTIDKHTTEKQVPSQKGKYFSNWFVRGTTKEYTSILSKINNRDYFTENEQKYIDAFMKHPFESPEVIYGGEKSGSLSGGAFTTVLYETTKDENRVELAIFLGNLTVFQRFMYSLTISKLKYDLLTGKNTETYKSLLK